MEEKIKQFFFGSIRKKLFLAFGLLALLLITLVFITYRLNSQIAEDASYIREVNAPLQVMVEQVIGYDAMLTGAAHAALLHAQNGEFEEVRKHKLYYDETGGKLDSLLKFEARALINKSRRSDEEKNKVYGYLEELDKINLELVGLELGAFDAMESGDVKKAYSLVVSVQYHDYKAVLAGLYQKWLAEEARIADAYRQRLLDNTRKVRIYNLGMGALFIAVSLVIPFIINAGISKPILVLTDATRRLEKGDFKQRVEAKTNDEIGELAESFNRTSEQLERIDEERKQIDKAKTEFLSITSHELRSPMTPMRAQLQMLLESYFGRLNAKQRESLEVVLRNTERLDRIIQDFLEISRIEAARLKFNFVKASLNGPIANVVDEMKGFMPEKQLRFITDAEKLPVIEVDPDRVMQVLRNLLNNATKFSREKGRIWVNAEAKENFIIVTVKDEGAGIRAHDQPRIFEPFFQAGGMYERKVGGTGLGLAICKGIIESQNGKIWFESAEGKGTVFHFTVPFTPVREMKPIRVLFSQKKETDGAVRKLMVDLLGPLGENEFEVLQRKNELDYEKLAEYVRMLGKKGVLSRESAESAVKKLAGIEWLSYKSKDLKTGRAKKEA